MKELSATPHELNPSSFQWRLGDPCPKALTGAFSYNIPERGLMYVTGGMDVGEDPSDVIYLANGKRFIYDYATDS